MRQSSFLLAFLTLALAAMPAAAHRVDVEPDQPVDDAPFRLLFTGEWSVRRDFRDPVPSVEIDGSRIRVVQRVDGAAPPQPYGFTVLIEPPAAGEYTVELVLRSDDGPDQTLATRELSVFPGIMVRSLPAVPTSAQPFRLEIGPIGLCPTLDGEVSVEGRTILVPVTEVVCDRPRSSSSARSFLRTPPIGPLAAGDYTVVLPSSAGFPVGENNIFHRSSLTVQPDPVPLAQGRFEVEVTWRDFAGQSGRGVPAREPSSDSVLFWFFEPANWELTAKVLNGCQLNGHWWVFANATTSVEHTLRVQDRQSGAVREYTNPLGRPAAAVTDTRAFPCAGSAPP